MGIGLGKGVWIAGIGLSVQTPTISPISNSDVDDPTYAGIGYMSDGGCDYADGTTGGFFYAGKDWLLNGLNSQVWVYATKIAGAATVTGTVGSSLILTSNRTWRIQDSAGGGSQTATMRIQLYDDASQTNELDTRDYVLLAQSLL